MSGVQKKQYQGLVRGMAADVAQLGEEHGVVAKEEATHENMKWTFRSPVQESRTPRKRAKTSNRPVLSVGLGQ